MRVETLGHEIDIDGWRAAARRLRLAGVAPENARFRVAGSGQGGLLDHIEESSADAAPGPTAAFAVPRTFLDLAGEVILHRSADRFDLM